MDKLKVMTMMERAAFEIGDKVYLDLIDGPQGTIIGFVVYPTHLEYQVRTLTGVHQLEEVVLSETRAVI